MRLMAGFARGAFAEVKKAISRLNSVNLGVALIALVLAILIRVPLLDFKSPDFYASLKPWYNVIRTQGFSAFATNFSTYNPPYLYLLYLIARFIPGAPIVVAVKLPALIADFVCAYLVYRIVRLRFPNGLAPLFAGIAVLFAPSVVLNSALWGQADSLFTAGILACVYFLMVKQHGWALFFFGIALAFKLQAIFLAPLLLALFLRGTISWKYFLLLPAMLTLALVPAWMAGRPLQELMNIYLYQTSQFEAITMNAASIYTWLPSSKQVFNLFYIPGVIFGASMAFMLVLVIYRAPRRVTQALILESSLAAMLIVPFFLPKMHDRYFYPADVLSIAFAFFFPQFFFIPLLVVGVSFLSYQPFLFLTELIPFPFLTFTMLGVISLLAYHAIMVLYAPEIGEAEVSDLTPVTDSRPAESGTSKGIAP